MSDYEFHPIADLFPLIEGKEFEKLYKDVWVSALWTFHQFISVKLKKP